MAYVIENSGVSKGNNGNGTTVDCPISSLALQDDVAIAVLMRSNGGSATTPSGWQSVTVEDNRLSIFYKNMGATPDTSIAIPTSATISALSTFVVRGCDVSTSTSAYDSGSYANTKNSTAIQITGPSITPSNANSTIILGCGEPSGQCMVPSHGAKYVAGTNAGNCNITVLEDFQESAAATTGYVWHRNHTGTTSINGVFSFALVDAGSNELKAYLDWSANPPVTPIHFMGLSGESGISASDTAQYDPTTEISSISDGYGGTVSTIYDALGYQENIMQGGTYTTLTNSNSEAASVSGSVLASIPTLTGKNICFSTKPRFTNGISSYSEVGAYFILSDQTNSRVWMYGGNDTSPNIQEGVYPILIDPDGGYEWEDIGTVTLSNCDTLVVGFNKPTTDNESLYYSPIVLLEALVLEGGSSVTAASMVELRQIVQLNRLNTVLNQGGQTDGQFICFQDVEVSTDHWDGSAQAVAYPQAYNEASGTVQAQIADGSLSFLFSVPDGATVIDKNKVYDMGSYHSVGFKSTTSTHATTSYDVNGATWLNSTPYLNEVNGALGGLLIADSKEAVYTTLADCSGGVVFSGCVDTQAITVTSEADFAKLANCTFSNNNRAIKITGNQTGSWSDPNLTVSGNTYDIEYTGTTDFEIQSATTLTVNNTSTGTLTIATPVQAFQIDSSETGSLIQIFTTGTQTVLDSTTGSSLNYPYTGTVVVDYVVQKAGFLPQRFTGVTLTNSTASVVLADDPVYDSGHGLSYTTDFSYNRSTKELTLSTRQEGRDFYSALIDAFIAQTALRNTAFDFKAVGPDSIFFLDDAEIVDSSSEDNWKGAGIRYLSSSDVVTAEWVSVKSAGTIPAGATGEYQQVDGSGTTDLRATGAVDQIIKVYGDATHGNFDYRGHLVVKYQVNGYREVRADVLDLAGVAALEPFEYSIAMEPVAINAATGDPAVSITVTDHGASPVTWNSKDWSITVVDSGTVSGEDILRELNYNLSLDTTYQGKDPFNWPEMVVEAGSAYETGRGITEGGVGAALKGVRILRGSSEHPDFTRMQADDGTYWSPTATFDFTIDNLETGSQVVLYETGTQTIVDSTASSGTSYNYTGTYTADQVVDYTIIKVGFAPIRVVGVTISSSPITQSAIMVEDRVYVASSGLTFGTTATVNTTTKIFGLTTGSTVQNYYSFMVESWRDETALRNKAFPLSTNGPNSISLNEDYEFNSSSDIGNLSRDGMRYVDASGTTTASWCAIFSQGDMTGLQAEYQQVDGTSTTDTLSTGVVDQLIQIYGDASHGNFDYTGHLVIKCQANGYRQARVDVVDVYGTLEDQLYVVSLAPEAISGLTLGDPAASGITVTDHGASPVTWNGKQFSVTVTDSGANSGEVLLRELNYNLSLDTTYQGKDPFNWGEMVVEAGSEYESLRGELEGDTGADLKGVRVVRGTDPHPDFTRFQADDGTYYTVPVTANGSISGITSGSRLRIYNETTATETYNDVPGTSYSVSYTEGTTYSSGDVIKIYVTQTSGTTAQLPFSTTTVASSTGWTALVEQESDTVYDSYGLNGSAITKFTADYVNDEVDLIVSSNFSAAEFYAWWCYNLTTSQGISDFFGGITAQDAANLRINNDVISMYLDNTTTTNVYQTDNIRIYRTDQAYPVKNPTSGGGGIDVVWRDRVYIAETGVSGLTAAESTQLFAASTFNPAVDVVEGSETWQESMRLVRAEAAGKVAVSGATVSFRDAADSKDRIVATVDEQGQRTAITTDVS